MSTGHTVTKYYAISIAPLTGLYYLQPALAVAATAAIATVTGIQQLLRRRKPTP